MKRVIDINFDKVRRPNKRTRLVEGKEVVDSSDSDSSDSDDDHAKQIKKQLAAHTGAQRQADMFTASDPTAGQLFVFCGKSERGKTHFLKWLLVDQIQREINPIKTGIVFVKTKFKHSYDFVPDDKIFQGYDEEILTQYVTNLEALYEQQGYLDPSFLVFDDLLGVIDSTSHWFNNFMATYRHLNIHIFLAVQYLTGRRAVSPIMREQTTFALMFNSKTNQTIKHLYENFGQLFEKEKEFKKYYFDNTEPSKVGDYVCIAYKEKEDRLEENYTPMRAPKKIPKINLDY